MAHNAFEKGNSFHNKTQPYLNSVMISTISNGSRHFLFWGLLTRISLIDLAKGGSISKTIGIYMWMTFRNLEQSLWVLIPALKIRLVNMNMTRDEFKGQFSIFPIRYVTLNVSFAILILIKWWALWRQQHWKSCW